MTFLDAYTRHADLFRSVRAAEFNSQLFQRVVRTLGILNFENDTISGERWFLATMLAQVAEPLVIDVGASVGAYSALVKAIAPHARVYALEPSPVAYAQLEQAAARSGFEARRVGCSDREGEVQLYDYRDNQGSEHASVYRDVIEVNHKGRSSSVTVEMTTLDRFMDSNAISAVTLLKVDTEGHELPVLRGAERAIRGGHVFAIQFEFNEMNVYSRTFFKDLHDFLPEFELFRLLPDGLLRLGPYRPLHYELYAFQNIVALRRELGHGK
jgi:FkbM family methyltransferase